MYPKKIILRRGQKIELKKDTLEDGELAFCKDTQESVIGTINGPVVFAKHGAFLDGIEIKKSHGRYILYFPYTYKKDTE